MALTARRRTIAGVATALIAPAVLAGPAWAAPAGHPVPAAVGAGQCGGQAMARMAGRYASGLESLHGAAFEQAFMAGMIPHHAAAVAMARIQLARGSDPRLKAMSHQIIASQDLQIAQMTTWLRDWYHLTPAQAHNRTPARLRQMENQTQACMRIMTAHLAAVPAGNSFDRAFMPEMISHHEMAVIEAGTVPGRAVHPQLIVLARQIIASQRAEIRQMRQWLHTWYHA